MSSRVLITGGSGFIGRYFYERFMGRADVVILDLVKPEWDAGRASFVQGDVRDPAVVESAMKGCDQVLSLAAAHHDFGIAEPTFFEVNEKGSAILCEAADRLGVRDVCFYSTVAIYGDTPEPHREDSPKSPVSPYGKSKLAGEKVFERWTGKGQGRRCLVIRPTVTFGPRNFANMYTLINQISRRRFFPVGDGSNIKSLSYVENIVDLTLHLWDRPAWSGMDIYNYIDKPDLTSREITAQVYESLGRKAPALHMPLGLACAAAFPFDVVIKATGKNLPISSARIRKICTQTKYEADRVEGSGWKPKVSLREGIDRMVKWYLAEGRHQSAIWHLPPPWRAADAAGAPLVPA